MNIQPLFPFSPTFDFFFCTVLFLKCLKVITTYSNKTISEIDY